MRSFFRDMKITTKISLLVGVALLLMSSVIWVGLWQVSTIGKEMGTIVEEEIPLLRRSNTISFHRIEQEFHLERAIEFGQHVGQEELAKEPFEAEVKNFLKHSRAITKEIEEQRALVEHIYEKHGARRTRGLILEIDYELRSLDKEQTDYQSSAETVFNLLSRGKLKEAEARIQKIMRNPGEEAHSKHFASLENYSSSVETFVKDSILRTNRSRRTAMIGLLSTSVTVLSLCAAIGFSIARGIREPLRSAVEIANQIARGQRKLSIQVTRKDEMGILLATMKDMCEAIGSAEEELSKSEQRFRAVFEGATDGVLAADASSRKFIFGNPRICEIVGYPLEELLELDVTKIIPEKDMAYVLEQFAKQGRGEIALAPDIPVLRKDGKVVYCDINSAPIRIGNQELLVGFFRDITERKQAEKRQAQLLKEVEAANQELKDFAYITSHDLKAPLRSIATLTSWISSDYADKLDEDGKKQMELLLGRVKRMHELIDGILRYSRVGRIKEEETEVNLNDLTRDVIETIGVPENIEVRLENELPSVLVERIRMRQVFQNLIGNAVEYMDKPEGEIRIGCVSNDDHWEFSVADNGPGIEDKYFEKIFKIFQTLNSRDKVESTGIGLTLVKKIVETYGGKVWVESEKGKGSTFHFTLPKEEEDERQKVNSSC